MKKALVKPLDSSDLKNHRPVSNPAFVSKVIERTVANQLKSYISANNLDAELQSAYRAKHSIETAPLKVVSDIRLAVDKTQGVFIVLQDLSAAFDTVQYDILVGRLVFVVWYCND